MGTGSASKSAPPANVCPTRRAEGYGTRFASRPECRVTETRTAMEQHAGGRTASALFAGFRALGLFSNEIPHVVRFSALKRRFYVTTCVGKSFHTYDVSDFFLGLCLVNYPLGLPSSAVGILLPRYQPGLRFLSFSPLTPPCLILMSRHTHVLI